MPIRNDSDAFPVGSVIRIKRTNEFAIFRKKTFQKDGKRFLNYLVEIEDKEVCIARFTMTLTWSIRQKSELL
jgi:hypothetical protein